MKDCIIKEIAIERLKRAKPPIVASEYGAGYVQGLKEAIEILKRTPGADVQPVRRGRWLNHHAIWIDQPKIEVWFVQAKCSECEKWAHVMNPYTKSIDYECCPHCGARMNEEGEKK